MKLQTAVVAVVSWVCICSPVLAHPNHAMSRADGLVAGLAHPWLGFDHLLAMVAVGLLSVQIGGRAVWVLPSSFLSFLAVGGAIGMSGFDLHLVEIGVALSVVLLGAALAAGRKYPLLAAAIAIGGMGLLHGHAHGTEMPMMATPALYAVGFITATAFLHLLGIAAGTWLTQSEKRIAALRFSGAMISFAGVVLLLGTI